jgi:hypothetical protein
MIRNSGGNQNIEGNGIKLDTGLCRYDGKILSNEITHLGFNI